MCCKSYFAYCWRRLHFLFSHKYKPKCGEGLRYFYSAILITKLSDTSQLSIVNDNSSTREVCNSGARGLFAWPIVRTGFQGWGTREQAPRGNPCPRRGHVRFHHRARCWELVEICLFAQCFQKKAFTILALVWCDGKYVGRKRIMKIKVVRNDKQILYTKHGVHPLFLDRMT